MRIIKTLPALALGLALTAPMAHSQTMPSLQFPQAGTFCGLLTLCGTAENTKDIRTPSVALLSDKHAQTEDIVQPTSEARLKRAALKKAKH
ncbi:MAG: hypothetical protein ACSHXB_13720 [Sulfitobacter sp.]